MISLTLISILFIILAIFTFLMDKWYNGPLTPLVHEMKNKIIIITGGSRGIGFETAKSLLKNGATVILASRKEKEAIDSINSLDDENEKSRCIFMHLDLTNYDSILTFSQEIVKKFNKIDILINNAGSCFQFFTETNGIENTYFTNHVGHLILTVLLLNHFNEKGKIINVSTTKYKRITEKILNQFTSEQNLDFSYTKKNYDWMKTYVLSKLADVHFTTYLSEYIEKNKLDLKTSVLHPGFINNHFFRDIEANSIYWFVRDTLQIPFRWCIFKNNIMGAQTTLHCAYMNFEELINGGYYVDCHFQALKEIGKIQYAKKMINFTKMLIEKNNIVNGNEEVMKFFI